MRRPFLVYGMILALATGGCVSNPHGHGGEFVVEYRPGDQPSTCQAPYKAVYVLYQWHTLPGGPPPHTWIPEQEVSELFLRGLGRWEKVGFEKGSHGELLAVAGGEKISLAEGHYCWHITTASEYQGMQRILHETGENVVTVVSLPFGLAACVCMMPIYAAIGLVGLGGFVGAAIFGA